MVAGEAVDVVGIAGRVATGGWLTEAVECVAHGRRCSVVEESSERDGEDAAAASSRFPHVSIAALGLVTVAAYGSAYYAFGVLLGPILDDTDWSEALVAGAFSASTLIGAFGAGIAGRLVDSHGARRVMLGGGLAGCLALMGAAWAPNVGVFVLAYAVGGGLLSAAGFYHVTQAAAARVSWGNPARGIMLLTLYGAFAGPIYLPVTGFLVEATDWRTTLLTLAGASMVGFVLAAVVLDGTRSTAAGRGPTPSIRESLNDPRARALMISALIGGVGLSTLMVYQVPLMVAAGLPLSTAAVVAGLRGFAQFGGRLGVMPLLSRVPAQRLLMGTYLLAGVAALLLSFSGTVPVAVVYVVIAGVAIGVWSPMEAIFANEVFPPERVATFLGTQRMIGGIGGSIGPVTAGILAETTGSRAPTIALVVVGTFAAATVLALAERRAKRVRA